MENEYVDSEEGFDALFDHAWETWEESYRERLSWIREEWDRALGEPSEGPGEVAVAFDGDEPGVVASNELMVKLLSDSPTYTNYLRSILIHGNPISQSIRLLANRELADEISFWDNMAKVRRMPDWWYEMCQEQRSICLAEITRRSRKLNDHGGIEYIKVFNANNSITDVLAQYGVMAVAGRTVRCPMHDDSSPSLSISKNDERAYCFNQACILWHEGHGVDPFDLNKILSR